MATEACRFLDRCFGCTWTTGRRSDLGSSREVDVFFDNSPVFRLTGSAATPVARFVGTPLRSGWARGQEQLAEGVAVIDAPVGRGRVLVFGPQIAFRAQSHATFKFLFNAIFYSRAEPRPPPWRRAQFMCESVTCTAR